MVVLSKFYLVVFVILLFTVCSGVTTHAITIADSINEFSKTQGQDNWFYGYYDGDSSNPFSNDPLNDDFEQLPVYAQGGWRFHSLPQQVNPFYWTRITTNGGQPNGPGSVGVNLPDEHWTTRRWLSEVDGEINISGTLAKENPNGGDGITGIILIDGLEVFSQPIAFNDIIGIDYSVNAFVNIGSLVDFVIKPGTNSTSDVTIFNTTIDLVTVPEPSTIIFFGIGSLYLICIRRKRPNLTSKSFTKVP